MARKLKVFVVPAGFHDAYVAAPSRKAALAAWGSEHDLFARGVAQEVTDPALMAEPLAHPGEVVKRSRGTTAEQIAALPATDAPPSETRAAKSARAPKAADKLTKPRRERPPKPSRDALDAAEQALDDSADGHRRAAADLAERQKALDREKQALTKTQATERRTLEAARDDQRARYDRAMAQWRER